MINMVYQNVIEIPGAFLVPGFSIYVLEVIKDNKKWFYIGMTGDPYYPSARSAFHRLSGHLEKSKGSTQNQLKIALHEKLGITNDKELSKLTFRMYHYPISGFREFTADIFDTITVSELKNTGEYEDYKRSQRLVHTLEKALIFKLGEKRLNKTNGKQIPIDEIPFQDIYNNILELIK